MLSRKENWLNIWAIKYLTHTRVIPFHIDSETGKIQVLKDAKALLAGSAYLATVQFHSLYTVYSAGNVLGRGLRAMKWALPYYFYKIFVPQIATLVALMSFLVQPEVFAALFDNSVGATGDEQRCKRKKRTRAKATRKFLSLSYNEMLTVLQPIVSFPAGLLILAGVTIVDFWPLKLDKLLTASSFLKILADGVAIFSWVSWGYFAVHFQFLFLEKVNYSLKQETAEIRY